MSSSAPEAPNYMLLANYQAKKQNEYLEQQNKANRPNVYTANGSQVWGKDAQGNPTLTQTLDPESQRALDAQRANTSGLYSAANGMLGQVQNATRNPMDWGQFGEVGTGDQARDQAINAAYGQASSRLDPMWQQREEETRSRLYNQGFREGDQAFEKQMSNLGQQRNDAYQGALNSAIGQGTAAGSALFGQNMQSRQQAISEALRKRSQPLSEMQALTAGQSVNTQIGAPNFMGAAAYRAPDWTGAAQNGYQAEMNQYNADQARQQQMLSGFGNIAMLPFMF